MWRSARFTSGNPQKSFSQKDNIIYHSFQKRTPNNLLFPKSVASTPKNSDYQQLKNKNSLNQQHSKKVSNQPIEMRLPINRKLMVVKKSQRPRGFVDTYKLKCKNEESSQKQFLYHSDNPNHKSQTDTSNTYDPKTELKAKIIKAIFSSNETIERDQAYRREYKQQQQYLRNRKIKRMKKMNNSMHQDFKQYLNNQNLKSPKPSLRSEFSQRGELCSFQANDLNISKRISIKIQENGQSEQKNRKKPVYADRQKKIISQKKNDSGFKSEYCNKVFGKYLSDPQKKKQFEEIRPWVITDIDSTFNLKK